MEVIITILALSIVIFIHEMGHLLAAKYSGVGVYEFSVGMGPKLLETKVKETVYSLRLFPIGGFVKLAGLDDERFLIRLIFEKSLEGTVLLLLDRDP